MFTIWHITITLHSLFETAVDKFRLFIHILGYKIIPINKTFLKRIWYHFAGAFNDSIFKRNIFLPSVFPEENVSIRI